jgi:hypothetical protein
MRLIADSPPFAMSGLLIVMAVLFIAEKVKKFLARRRE